MIILCLILRTHIGTVQVPSCGRLKVYGQIYLSQFFVMNGGSAKEVLSATLVVVNNEWLFYVLPWCVTIKFNFLAIEASSPRRDPKYVLFPLQKSSFEGKTSFAELHGPLNNFLFSSVWIFINIFFFSRGYSWWIVNSSWWENVWVGEGCARSHFI